MTTQGWLADERGAVAAQHLLDTAGALFEANGVSATSMAQVAAAAGCSRATLYRYFENRRALLQTFVNREARRVAGEVRVARGGDPDDGDLVEAVLAAIAAVRANPVLRSWFSDTDAGVAADLARTSEVVDAIAAAFLGDPSETDVRARSRWLVRCIVSLLTVPGADADDERAMVQRFVLPVVSPA